VTASFAVLADRPVVCDCDVDAADLHLVLEPSIRERHEFESGNEAIIRPDDCTSCGVCTELCRFGAVKLVRTVRGIASILSILSPARAAVFACGFARRKPLTFPRGTAASGLFRTRVAVQWFMRA